MHHVMHGGVTCTLLFVTAPFGSALDSGDAVLHLGPTGYAARADASVADLDYSKDFSVEVTVNIPAHTPGGRWATAISKTSGLYTAAKGFGIGFDQSRFSNFGQRQ